MMTETRMGYILARERGLHGVPKGVDCRRVRATTSQDSDKVGNRCVGRGVRGRDRRAG